MKKAILSLRENYGQAMAVTAPLGSVVSTTTAAISFAGSSIIFTTLLSLLASGLWIYTLSLYTRKVASAGGYYSFNYCAWRSKKFAFLEALTEVFAYSLLNAVNAISAYLMVQFILDVLDLQQYSWLSTLVLLLSLLYPTLISLIDIKKLLGIIVTVSATLEAVFLILLFVISLQGGLKISLLVPHFDNLSDLGTAFLLTTVSIAGAGAATYLGEETKKPHENVTKGMWMALGIGGLSILLGTYALIALWSGSLESLASSPQPLLSEVLRFGTLPLIFTIILAINSLLSSNIGTTVGASRILFNLARENAAPKIFLITNKHKQPIVSTVVVGIISGIFTIIPILYLGIYQAFVEVAAVESILWILGRVFDGFGVPIFYIFRLRKIKIQYIIIPVIASSINSWGIITSLVSVDIPQILMLITFITTVLVWYLSKASKGFPGSLIVNEFNEIVKVEEYFKNNA
ncbi:MAG: APC family permease [Ignisphaera sp.]